MERLTAAAAAELLVAAAASGTAVAEVLAVDGPAAGLRVLVDRGGIRHGTFGDGLLDDAALDMAAESLETGDPCMRSVQTAHGERTLFAVAHRPAERLVVVGAGHIAVPLAELGVRLGFAVTVLDDREEFATSDRFPGEARVVRCDFEADPFAGVRIDARTYVALVTRGHRWDFDCLQRLLAADARPRYIGMIGSRRRVRAALSALLAAGVERARLASVRAPIGLEIGAETPEEIAIAIAAEMIAVRRGASIETLTARERVLERLLPRESEQTHG